MKRMRIFMLLIVVLFLFATSFVATTIAKYVKEENTATFNLTVRADGKIDLELTNGNEEPETKWTNHNIPIIPGTTAEFDPYVRVGAGSEPAYIFIEVTKKGSGQYTFDDPITLGLNSGWKTLETETNDENKTERTVFYWEGDAEKSANPQYFPITASGTVEFSDAITEEDLGSFHVNGFPEITITAYAVQKTELGDSTKGLVGDAKAENPAAAWEYLKV